MQTSDLALVRGIADTRATLDEWNDRPGPVVGRWLAGAFAITVALLTSVWLIAMVSVPDPGASFLGLSERPHLGQVLHVLGRNALVLALHAMACVAGFMAGSSLSAVASGYSGLWRKVHDRAGPLAIAFVIAATVFSLTTQAYALGLRAADLSGELGLSPLVLLLGLLPHALPELTALFLPLAAWTLASRRGEWRDLLAATFVTVAVAVPVLVAAAAVETWVTPRLLLALAW